MANNRLHLDFGLFNVDLNRVIRLVKEDLKDDWLLDPLQFEDRLHPKIIANFFAENIDRNNGEYLPSMRKILNIPKRGYTLRHSLETHMFDRIAYHSFGKILLKHFDCLINRRVFNHRLNVKCFGDTRQNRYLFLNSIDQWKKFVEFIRVDASDKVVLEADLQNYYENISLRILKETLYNCLGEVKASGKEKARIRFCIESICRCLKLWMLNGETGLPQNRDISSFLANIYMLPIDRFMISNGYDYYRYMDDIRILCRDKYQARRALQHLIEVLRDRGLNVNSAKTQIMEPGTVNHIKLISSESSKLERIDALLETKKKNLVSIAFTEIRDSLVQLVQNQDVDSREFRFYVGRMCKIAQCKDIVKPRDFFEKITDCMIDLIDMVPHSMDQYYAYFASVKPSKQQLERMSEFLMDSERAIYGWQNYQIWKIFVLHDFDDTKVSYHAQICVDKSNDSANVAGAILYIGRFGGIEQRRRLLQKLRDCDCFFLQRHFMVALQEVPYSEIKQELDTKALLPESVNIYRNLASLSQPRYMEPPKPIAYTDLIREVAFYA